MATPHKIIVAVLGGTGKEGKGLVYRLAKGGYRIFIGSRSPEKAQEVAEELTERLGGIGDITGKSNLEAADKADIIILTVPYKVHGETLNVVKSVLRGKILVDVTVPLVPPLITTVMMPKAGSAAQEAHVILGEEVQVTSAFHTISYERLISDQNVDCDVLVTGTSKEARLMTLRLVTAAGLTGWDAGPLENSVVAEGLTSILIGINKRYGSTSAGIRITGADPTMLKP